MRTKLLLALAPLSLASCIVDPGPRPTVDLELDALSQYNFRGQVFSDEPVIQSGARVGLATKDGGNLVVDYFGNTETREDNGNAWLPDGHAGKFSNVELQAAYSRRVGDFDITGGLTSYILPNGLEFPNGERGETVELFVSASTEVAGVVPSLVVHYDIDEVEDVYATVGVGKTLSLAEKLSLELNGQLAYSGEDASLWTYGIDVSGISDARVSAELNYDWDANTLLRAGINGSRIVDSELRDWFDILSIEQDNVWANIGITWLF